MTSEGHKISIKSDGSGTKFRINGDSQDITGDGAVSQPASHCWVMI
jgi:hypothetical protein